MAILHADLKDALIRGDAFAVFEFDDPDGNIFKYAGKWVDSTSLGQYKGFIPKGGFTNSARIIPLRGDRMQDSTMTITVLDMDGELKTLVSGEHARRVFRGRRPLHGVVLLLRWGRDMEHGIQCTSGGQYRLWRGKFPECRLGPGSIRSDH